MWNPIAFWLWTVCSRWLVHPSHARISIPIGVKQAAKNEGGAPYSRGGWHGRQSPRPFCEPLRIRTNPGRPRNADMFAELGQGNRGQDGPMASSHELNRRARGFGNGNKHVRRTKRGDLHQN